MTRMTNALRDAIVENALKKCGYTEARARYASAKETWGEAVRLAALGVGEAEAKSIEKKAQALYAKLPDLLVRSEGELYRRDYLVLTVAGQRDTVHFKEGLSPWKHEIAFDHPLAVERENLINENDRLNKWYADVHAPVRAAVNSVNTVAQLLKAWPESKELIPEHVAEAKSHLPAVRASDLNALIGLPTE